MHSPEQRPLLNRRYDIAGNSIARQVAHYVRMKISIMGNYNTGPGIRCLATLALLHYFGRPLFWLRTRANSQYLLKRKLKALLARVRPPRKSET